MLRRCLVPAALLLAAGSVIPLSAPASAAPVVLAQWKLDEPSAGDVAADQTGTNPGTPAGIVDQILPAPSAEVAPVGYANPRSLEFSGDNYLQVANPVAGTGDFSVCAWIRTTAGGAILDSSVPGSDLDYSLSVGPDGLLRFANGGLDANGAPVDTVVTGATPVADGAWHSVCATRDSATGTVGLYVDAVLDGQGTTPTGPLAANPEARIGYGYDGASPFVGLIDEVAVYGVALSATQVQNLRSGGPDPDTGPDLPLPSIAAPLTGPTNSWSPVVAWDEATACQYSWDGTTWVDVDCAAGGADIAPPGPDGTYTLHVRGRSAGTLWSGGVAQTFVWDTTAPEVQAGGDRSVPSAVTIGDATASDATAGIASYAWTKQSGPGAVTFDDASLLQPLVTATKDGVYDLRLTVTDLAGNVSQDDVELTWDATAPAIAVDSRPTALTNGATARFAFEVDEEVSGPSVVECSIDGKDFAACTSPVSYPALADGEHTWKVRATDALGNRRVHTTVRWVVDTAAPTLTRVGPELIEIQVGTPYSDQGAVARDSHDGDVTAEVETAGRVDSSQAGTYVLEYGVRDEAGNVAQTLQRTVRVVSPFVDVVAGTDEESADGDGDDGGSVLDLDDVGDAQRSTDDGDDEQSAGDGDDEVTQGELITNDGESSADDAESDVVDSDALATVTEAAPATGLRRSEGVAADVGSILAGSLLVMGALFVMARRRHA